MLFGSFEFNKEIAREACRSAAINWEWWKVDFCHSGPFAQMPVFQSYPRFRGFGADYSVFRGLTADQAEGLRQWFLQQSDPETFDEIYEKLRLKLPGQHRISLLSKLLTMWKPQKYAMWDTLAKAGLRQIHDSERGHCYNLTTPEQYNIFRADFFDLYDRARGSLIEACAYAKPHEDRANFAPRVLDSYLMHIGKNAKLQQA